MIYFKHSELVNDYHVSLKTVHNWIDAAKQGKLELTLHELKGRTYVANTPANLLSLEKLADRGKKYRNTLHQKIVTPKTEFYDTYTRRQILDIISNLRIHREIPQQYNYLDGGAKDWDDWIKRLSSEDAPSILKGTIELLASNLEAVDKLVEDYDHINIIDVGIGNALPSKGILAHLLKKNKLHRYIGIDIGASMLQIAERNIKKWFDDRVRFEGHVRDISFERFDDLLVDDMLKSSKKTVNIVLLLGSTPANFRFPVDVLRVVYNSMGSNDMLLYTRKPDTKTARRYFDFKSQKGESKLPSIFSFALNQLNVDPSMYEAEMGFDDQSRMRYVQIRLKMALTIRFKFDDGDFDVSFEKGDAILAMRVWHQTLVELITQFEEVGFSLLHSSLTKDREYLLTIFGVTSDSAGAT